MCIPVSVTFVLSGMVEKMEWLTRMCDTAVGVDFQPLNATARLEAVAKLDYLVEPLRRLAPDMGAYMNEVRSVPRFSPDGRRCRPSTCTVSVASLTCSQASPYEPGWQNQFWGSNYERLVQIKRAVDPDDVLWCNPCVGNERWREVGNQLCRV